MEILLDMLPLADKFGGTQKKYKDKDFKK